MPSELDMALGELGISGDDLDEVGAYEEVGGLVGDIAADIDDIAGDDEVGARAKRVAKRVLGRYAQKLRRAGRTALSRSLPGRAAAGARGAAGSPLQRAQQLQVYARAGSGDKAIVYVPCVPLSLAATVAGVLTFTPNDDVEIIDCVLDVNVAAAAAAAIMPAALGITAITVGSRNLFKAAAGSIPVSVFQPRATMRHEPWLQWGAITSSQVVTIALTNNDAATTQIVSGTLVCLGGI